MIKHVFASCSLVLLLALGSLPALAQTAAPATPPAPSTAQPQEKVSPDELRKFSMAVKQMLTIADDADKQMLQAVRSEGLTEDRFGEIHTTKTNPSSKPKTPITSQEQKKYEVVVAKLEQIQKDANTKMDQAVQSQGLKSDRFNQIFEAIQNNPNLRQEVQKLIQTQ